MGRLYQHFQNNWSWDLSPSDNCDECSGRAELGPMPTHFWNTIGTAPLHPWCFCLVKPVYRSLEVIDPDAFYGYSDRKLLLSVGCDPIDIYEKVSIVFNPPPWEVGLSTDAFRNLTTLQKKQAMKYTLDKPLEFNKAMRVLKFSIRASCNGRFYWVREESDGV